MTAEGYYYKGVEYYKNGDYENALLCFDKSIELDENHAQWHGKGIVYKALKDYENALKCFNKAIELDKSDAYPWNGRGIIYGDLKDYENALISYNKAIKLDGNYAAPWNGKGIVYDSLKDYDNALISYNKAIELDENFATPWYGKGIVYKALKDYDNALKCFNKAIELDENDAHLWSEKGDVYNALKDYESALKCFNKAIELDGNDATPWHGKGNVYKALKDYENALISYNKAIELDENYAYPWNGKGNIYNDLNDYDNALISYNKAIELDKSDAYPWNGRGIIYGDLKDYENALISYNKAIKLDENYATPWYGKGNVYDSLKDYDNALISYNKAIELDENDAAPWNGKGIVYDSLKDYDNALISYNKAIELDENNAAPWHGKGNVYNDLNDYDNALISYNKAIELDENNAAPWHGKGNIYDKLKNYDNALISYNKAIELDGNYAAPWNGKGNVYKEYIPDLESNYSYLSPLICFKRGLILQIYPEILSNYLDTWQHSPKHPFFLQEIFQYIPKYGSLYIKEQVTSMCQYINHWQKYLEKTEKHNQLSPVQKTQFQALINYFMGHPSKALNILNNSIIPQTSNNLQAYYYAIISCYEFLEDEEPYIEEAVEIAEQYRQQSNPENFIESYYAALIFRLDTEVEMALECIAGIWDKTDFLPLAYLYYQLCFEQKQAEVLKANPDKEWSAQDDRAVLYAAPFPKIAQYILKKEARSKEQYASGFTHHSIDPKRADWWQPLYHYAHYREISGAINLLHLQAVSHLNRKDVVAADDAKYFWEIFEISPQNITLMSEEIRKVGLQKVGQAFLNRAEAHIKDMVGRIDKNEEELSKAIRSVVYGDGHTKEQTKKTFHELKTTLEEAHDIEDALVHRIASKIEAEELGSDTETYLYLISYFLLSEELTPKESIYLQFYVLYADAFRSGGMSKVVQGGLKDVVKTLTGEGFDMAVDVLTAINPVTGLTKATLKPFVKGSMGEFFIAFLKGLNEKKMMKYSISQDFKDGYPVLSFKESFLEFVGKEKDRLGEQFEQTYPLYGYEDWLQA